jgi:two-component system LytT family response regulator
VTERGVALTALIVDDEALARRRLAESLRRHESVRVAGECENGPAALDAIRELSPDIVFLDVQMPGMTGFDVLARLRPDEQPVIIFCTAYDQYALAAFDVHAIDYLLKPFADERFDEALRRAEHAIRSRNQSELGTRVRALLDHLDASDGRAPAPGSTRHRLERFAVREREHLTVVDAASVDWIESAGDYLRIHVGEKSHLVRGTMVAVERRLDPARFLRIHRTAIVQLDRVRQLRVDSHGLYVVQLSTGVRLRVGQRYRNRALRHLGAKL